MPPRQTPPAIRPPLTGLFSRLVGVGAGFILLGACADKAAAPRPRNDSPVFVQAPPPPVAGGVNLRRFPDKVVAINATTRDASSCVITMIDSIRGELGDLKAGAEVTLMRTRFKPYTEPEAFVAAGDQKTVMECTTADGPVVINFERNGLYEMPIRR